MASLGGSFKLGNTGVSSLLRSASSLQREIATYQDDAARITYQNSGHTDEAYQQYVDYLQGRIKTLQSTGSITDLTKAQNMQQEIVSATHQNISYQIQQENMRLMATGDAGTVAGYQSKMSVVADEFARAQAIGDDTLAYSLQNQYYSLSQSMQKAQQAAVDASSTLQKANASAQGDVITSLKNGLDELNTATKGSSLQEFNATAKAWVQQNKDALGALGVKVDANSQPNYFDLVNAVQGAIYNHTVLQAQLMAPYDPQGAQNKLQDAQKLLSAPVQTLAGSLTPQQIQQAAQDPAMFAYDSSTGTFKQTAQIGYHYQTDQNGQNTLVPTYSGIVGDTNRNKVFFLNPQQTTMMSKLGLVFGENKNGTTGDGVSVQTSAATPAWLKNVLGGDNAVTNLYTQGSNGQLIFRAGSSTGKGFSAFILSNDGTGKYGVLEQTADGSVINAGGDYGFNAQAAHNLINYSMSATTPATALKPASSPAAPSAVPSLKVATPQAPPQLQVQAPAVPQLKTVSPQPSALSPQANVAIPQLTSGGFSLNTGGGGGIPLGRL